MFTILSAGIAPGLALLSYFYLRDKYTEPLHLVIRIFFFGCLLVFPVMFIQYGLKQEHIWETTFAQAFLQAGLLEELCKWLLLYYAVYKHAEFNEPFDGIVYGVSLSLGFATIENILYLYAFGVNLAFTRALLPVSGHALFGVVMGYYLGVGKYSNGQKKRNFLILSVCLPVLFHGCFDYILLLFGQKLSLLLPFMLFLWWLALKKVKIANERQLQQASESGLKKVPMI